MKGLLVAALCVAGMADAVSADQARPVGPADPPEALANGAIVTQETRSDESGASAHMQMLVHATPRAIWDVIVSCELAFRFVDGLQLCEVLEESPDRALVHQVVKRGWPTPTYDFVFESRRQPYRRIDIELVEGNLRAMDGAWAFSRQDGATLVDYRIHIRPRSPVPRFLVRRNLHGTMPALLACVRGLAGGSGTPAQEQDDLARCPGPPPR